jgi:polysaccharide biosynthesis/export protein
MSRPKRGMRLAAIVFGAALSFGGAGCTHAPKDKDCSGSGDCSTGGILGGSHGGGHGAHGGNKEKVPDYRVPKELDKVSMPPYMVEAPDILRIDALRTIPLPPYRIEPMDTLYLYAPGASDKAPINGLYPVDPDGTINLGPDYGGQLKIAEMTSQEAEKIIARQLQKFLRDSSVSVSLAQSKGIQQIRGEHLVNPDGTVRLGQYGSVYVTGKTLPQIKCDIEAHLSKFLLKPEVTVDVGAYNSKYYYVITDFAGNGEQVIRLPITGNETVLDSIAQVGGLSAVSTKQIWIARPAPAEYCQDQILPVDWRGISRRGHTRTNYQLLPGDRVFIMGNPLVGFDTALARVLNPIDRLLGTALIAATIRNGGIWGGNNNGVNR